MVEMPCGSVTNSSTQQQKTDICSFPWNLGESLDTRPRAAYDVILVTLEGDALEKT